MKSYSHLLCGVIAVLCACIVPIQIHAQNSSTPVVSPSANSTTRTVTGIVNLLNNQGKKTPAIGATVRIIVDSTITKTSQQTKGTTTNKNGEFSFTNALANSLIVASFLGYNSDTLSASQLPLEFTLRETSVDSKGVLVEADKTSFSNADVKTELITQKKLEQSACCSLAESFEKSPSVEVTFNDPATGSKTIQLLGLSGLYTQLLTETVPSIRGISVSQGLDFVPGPFIESISISKGATSVANGYEGMAGQINIEYKKPQRDIPFFANAYVNSMARTELNLTGAKQLGEKWSGMLMVHGSTFNHQTDGNNDGWIDMPLFNKVNVVGRIYHEDEVEFQFVGKALYDEHLGGTMTHGEHANHLTSRYEVETTVRRAEFFSKVALKNVFNEYDDRDLALIVSGSTTRFVSAFGDRYYNGNQQTINAKLIAIKELTETTRMSFGLSYLMDVYDERFLQRPFTRTESVPGAFAEITYTAIPKLTLVAGIRADHHSMFGGMITPRAHAKYDLSELTSIRASVGSGMRVANPVSDNLSSFINNRSVFIDSVLRPERAWNFGFSFNTNNETFGIPWTFDVEFFRTQFSNQVVVDLDANVRSVSIANLQGASFSNSALAQFTFTPITSFDVALSYRLIDARLTTGGILQERAMLSPHRVLSTLSYQLKDYGWQFDATLIWNSGGRLPSTQANPESFRKASEFPSFFRMNTQIQKRWESFDVYLGVENLTNFIQPNPIISPMNPQSPYFDASMIWGPLDNRMIYMGVRWRVQ
jgi:outer membrane receptor for ferrienterochelin and colicins